MCYPNDLDAAPGSAGRPFSPEALASWRNICHQEVLCAVNHRDSWYYNFHQHAAGRAPDGHSYEVVARQQSPPFAAYAAKAPGAAHILARSSLATPLASFASALVAETSREEREMSAHLFGEHFLDARIIQVSETPDLTKGGDPFHFVGVKYLALNSPAKLVKPRDYVYFEYTGSLIDANGEPVVFKVVRSMPLETIEFDCVAARALRHSSTPSQPLVRAELSCLFLFRGTDGGARTEVTVQSLHYFGGKVPSWATAKMLQPFWGGVLNMGTLSAACALQRHLYHSQSKPLLTKKMNSSPRSAGHRAPACRVCFRGKRLLPSTRVCLGCDQEVCKACTLRLHFLSGDDNDTVALRFCLNCVADARAVGRCSVDAVLLQTPQHQYLSDRQVTPASRSVPSSVLMM